MSDHYKKFDVDSVKRHSIDPEGPLKDVEWFRRYKSTLDYQFGKPKTSGRKPSHRKQTRKSDFESAFDRLDKKEKESRNSFTFQDPNVLENVLYELFFLSWYRTGLINARETVEISYFRWTKKIILR